VEILTVLAIATILASISVTSFSQLQSAKIGDASSLFSDYLREAQTFARASNSYVWVGFNQANNTSPLEVIAVQGTTGASTDLATTNGATQTLLRLVARPLILQGVVLDSYPSTNPQLPALPQEPTGTTVVSPISSATTLGYKGTFVFTVSGAKQTFSNTIGFTPRGEAFMSNPNTLVHWLQIGLAPYHYQASTGTMPSGQQPTNFGVLYMAGLSGEVNVFRP
jgi:Tfp pilus assembly protein FimT